jgi:3-oxoacyl-[acyl-carrier-protein] synthase-3
MALILKLTMEIQMTNITCGNKRMVKIISSGKYLPKRIVSSEEVDKLMKIPEGTIANKIGIKSRRYVSGVEETSSKMAAYAIMDALEKANLKLTDIDAIVCTSGTGEQEVPYDAALVLRNLSMDRLGMVTLDICTTCTSFITGLDVISYMIDAGRFNRVVVVSSDIASIAIDYTKIESGALFGDGAAAVILERTPEGECSGIIHGIQETFPEGAESCELLAGGSKIPSSDYLNIKEREKFLFQMNGKEAFKLASQVVKPAVDKLFHECQLKLEEMSLIIPHQASPSGMELIRKKLEVPQDKWVSIIENHGNMVAASIPLALSYALDEERVKRGDKIFLLGTSAGFGVAGLILEY